MSFMGNSHFRSPYVIKPKVVTNGKIVSTSPATLDDPSLQFVLAIPISIIPEGNLAYKNGSGGLLAAGAVQVKISELNIFSYDDMAMHSMSATIDSFRAEDPYDPDQELMMGHSIIKRIYSTGSTDDPLYDPTAAGMDTVNQRETRYRSSWSIMRTDNVQDKVRGNAGMRVFPSQPFRIRFNDVKVDGGLIIVKVQVRGPLMATNTWLTRRDGYNYGTLWYDVLV